MTLITSFCKLACSDTVFLLRSPQIILVSSSVSEQCLFTSSDEGTTFQKHLITFSVETLIFHPKEEDKLLVYTKDAKVMCGFHLKDNNTLEETFNILQLTGGWMWWPSFLRLKTFFGKYRKYLLILTETVKNPEFSFRRVTARK